MPIGSLRFVTCSSYRAARRRETGARWRADVAERIDRGQRVDAEDNGTESTVRGRGSSLDRSMRAATTLREGAPRRRPGCEAVRRRVSRRR